MQSFKVFPKKGLEPFEINLKGQERLFGHWIVSGIKQSKARAIALKTFNLDVAAILLNGKQADADKANSVRCLFAQEK